MPNFHFNEEEREKLILALLGLTFQQIAPPTSKGLSARETKVEEGHRIIHKYNCQGCHVVEQLFSPLADDDPNKEEHDKTRFHLEGRILRFYTEDETLGPPPLVTEAKRAKTPWVHSFIMEPGKTILRDKLKIRMPTFQMPNHEINTLVAGWAEEGNVEYPVLSDTAVHMSAKERGDAKTLFDRLQCILCHTVGRKATPQEMEGGSKGLAPDLALAGKRLHKEWIIDLLKDPQKMIPGTRMPAFWPDGTSPAPDIMGGNSEVQIELLARYLLSLGQQQRTTDEGERKVSQVLK